MLPSCAFGFQLFQYFIGPAEDFLRHASQFGYVDAEAMLAAARYQFSQEDDLVTYFLYGNIVIFYAVKAVAQFVKFVVMGGKQRFSLLWLVMQKLGNGPGDGNTIISGRTPANLI